MATTVTTPGAPEYGLPWVPETDFAVKDPAVIVPSNYELEQRALKKQIAEEDKVIARLASQL